MTTRHQAREAALQILYFCEVGRASPTDAADTFFGEHLQEAGASTRDFARRLVDGVTEERDALDALIAAHSQHWRVDRLATLDRLILRLGAWELRHEPETPPAVVQNEAIELARTFSADESVGFVNGVLDGIRKRVRPE
jgi:N utilization substance protein B